MAKKNDAKGTATETVTETETVSQANSTKPETDGEISGTVSETGRRVRRTLMLKQFADPDWINRNVVAKGKGTHVAVGRIYGIAREFRKNVNDVNGRQVESIAVSGSFEGVRFADGEILNGATVYFPMAYAERIAAALSMKGGGMVQVDCDVGVEATGKAIPYEWTITNFVEDKAENILSALKNRRVPKALAGPDTKKLQAPA